MAEREEREITSYIMATPIHGCVSLLLCLEVKLGWNSWKWELLKQRKQTVDDWKELPWIIWVRCLKKKKISAWYGTQREEEEEEEEAETVEGNEGKIHATHLNVFMGVFFF